MSSTRRDESPGFVGYCLKARRRLRASEILTAVAASLALASIASAGKIVLKNGFEVPGNPVNVPGLNGSTTSRNSEFNVIENGVQKVYLPYWLNDDGIRRYFVHRLNLKEGNDGVNRSDDTSSYVRFQLQPLIHRTLNVPVSIGRFAGATEWDEYGHRGVKLRTAQKELDVSLSLVVLDPRFLRVASTNYNWEFGIPPAAIPVPLLRKIIDKAIDPQNPAERLAVVRFFTQSGQLAGAREELDAIQRDFPNLGERVTEMQQILKDRYGLEALAEIRLRQNGGQHELARYLAQRTLQEDLSPATLREAQTIVDQYVADDDRMAQARALLGTLQAELPPDEARKLMSLRAAIDQELNHDTLPRLEPFLQAAEDPNLPNAEKLALAYSGWLLGPSGANTELPQAIALWLARFHILQYLHPASDRVDCDNILAGLKGLEGVSVPVVAQMIPQLPPPVEFPRELAGAAQVFKAPEVPGSAVVARYGVVVPREYNPARSYPAIVALRAEDRTIEDTLKFWAGTKEQPGPAQRQGYIVIAPDFASTERGAYDYGDAAHEIVQRSLFDARRRLNIDSNRVFLSGHGFGGDAAFDIGLSHPDLWAGVIPFTAQFQHAAAINAKAARWLPFYVIGGERDRTTFDLNANRLALRMVRGDDLIYCEYKGRGFESYAEELPRLFDWMTFHRRPRAIKEIDQNVLRPCENRCGWLQWTDGPAKLNDPIVWGQGKLPRALSMTGSLAPTKVSINARHPGKRTILRLSPDLVSYDQKVDISVATPNGTQKRNDFLTPSLGALLDDLRERGDRQQLTWTRLDL